MKAVLAAAIVAASLVAPAAVATEEPSAIGSSLVSFGPAVVDRMSPLAATLRVTNSGPVDLTDAFLTLAVTEAPLSSADEVSGFLADPTSTTTRVVAQEPRQNEPDPEADPDAEDEDAEPDPVEGLTLEGRSSAELSVIAPAADLDFPEGSWGVYGVAVTLEVGGHSLPLDAFVTTWIDTAMPSLDVAVLATADSSPVRADAVLTAASVPDVAVAVDPQLLTNAMVLEHGLRDREVFRLIPEAPDVTSLAHADDGRLLEFATSLPSTASLAPLTDAPVLAVPGAVDATTLDFVARHGAASALALPQAPGADAVEAVTSGAVARVGDLPVLAPHPSLSQALGEYRPSTHAARARLIAEAALAAGASRGEPVLIAPGSTWATLADGPSTALTALTEQSWVTMVPVSSLLETDAPSFAPAAVLSEDTDLQSDRIARLGNRLEALATLSTVTSVPTAAYREWGIDVLRGVAGTHRGQPTRQDAAYREAAGVAEGRLRAVRVPDSSDLNLLATSGDIPVTVVNGLDRPVTITVDLRSDSPNLLVTASPEVTVGPQEQVQVPVPVEAVSSADTNLMVTLRNARGEPVSEGQMFTVRVRADWGNAATAGFSVLLVLLLIAGVIRTIRRGRKDTRAEPSAAPLTAPDGERDAPPPLESHGDDKGGKDD